MPGALNESREYPVTEASQVVNLGDVSRAESHTNRGRNGSGAASRGHGTPVGNRFSESTETMPTDDSAKRHSRDKGGSFKQHASPVAGPSASRRKDKEGGRGDRPLDEKLDSSSKRVGEGSSRHMGGSLSVSPSAKGKEQQKSRTDASQDVTASKAASEGEVDRIVCTRYRLGKVLGKGSFGVIHGATDIHTGEQVAVKVESKSVKVPQLMYEARVYRQFTGLNGFPKLRGTGEDETSRMLVIDLLGSSLEDLFDLCARRFTLKTVLMLADQLLTRVQAMHQKGVVHRDMKPDNFLMGAGKKSNMVYLIDFGLSKIYMDPNTGNHFAQREKRINDLVGTARYCSIRSHLGLQLSRRDDLESLCHVLVYLAVPGLPWQGLHANSTKEKYDKIGKLKQSLSAAEICEGLPSCFEKFLDYSRNLDFEEEPDYDMCRGLFRECFQQYRIPDDDVFDWTHILGKGLLTIGVIGARGLVGKNSRGLSNPYCTVWVTTKGNKVMKEKTQIIEGNLTPLWDSLFEFPVSDDSAVLSIYVWSKSSGIMFRDRFLGRIVVPIDTLTEKTLLDEWHVLQKRTPKSNVAGDIHLRIYYRKGHPQT